MLFLHRLYLFCVCDTPLMCVSTTAACTKYHRVNTTKSSAVCFTGLDKPLSVNSSSPGHGSSLQGVLRSSSSISGSWEEGTVMKVSLLKNAMKQNVN